MVEMKPMLDDADIQRLIDRTEHQKITQIDAVRLINDLCYYKQYFDKHEKYYNKMQKWRSQ